MFIDFFYKLREVGIPVSPTSFITMHRALALGLVSNLSDFYMASRSILVKSERYFDLFDRVFAYHFEEGELPENQGIELEDLVRSMLEQWLDDPEVLAQSLGMDPETAARMTPEELLDYFMERLREQDGQHMGGNYWIGTRGFSPVGHSGYHPGGMRVGGMSRNKSAVKVALDRRYKDYSMEGPLKRHMMGEALKRLRNMVPAGPKDRVDVDETIYHTMKHAGEIEIIFKRSMKDRLKVMLFVDNGGWSMDPYIMLVQTLFDHARAQFKELKTYFFHNTIYDYVWEDPPRRRKPQKVEELTRFDPETRLVIVGDASMAPYELMSPEGSINIVKRSDKSSIEMLRFLSATFRHHAWLNPVPHRMWGYTRTIAVISGIFPMFELTIDGLEKAINHLMQ